MIPLVLGFVTGSIAMWLLAFKLNPDRAKVIAATLSNALRDVLIEGIERGSLGLTSADARNLKHQIARTAASAGLSHTLHALVASKGYSTKKEPPR